MPVPAVLCLLLQTFPSGPIMTLDCTLRPFSNFSRVTERNIFYLHRFTAKPEIYFDSIFFFIPIHCALTEKVGYVEIIT